MLYRPAGHEEKNLWLGADDDHGLDHFGPQFGFGHIDPGIVYEFIHHQA